MCCSFYILYGIFLSNDNTFFSRDQTVYTTSVMNKNIADVFSNTNIVRKHCLANIFVERKHQKM